MLSRITPLLQRHTGTWGARALPQANRKNTQQLRTLFTLRSPAYNLDQGVVPLISPRALKVHYYEFHQQYVELANRMTMETPPFDKLTPLEILKKEHA